MRRPSKDLILKFFSEAEELLAKGDLVQACEKYYKAAEEAVKLLAFKEDLKEVTNEVRRRGRWDSEVLFKASKLLRSVSPEIPKLWKSAWILHVDGFHELTLDEAKVTKLKEDVRRLVMLVTSVP